MHVVGVRELKNKLSEYLRLVRAGESVLITDRGEVIAELRAPGDDVYASLPAGARELARRGLIRVGAPSKAGVYPKLKRSAPDGTAARLLDADRAES